MTSFLKKIIFITILGLAVFLRFYKVTSFPPAPYWEEAALGYDAYSILKTGKDHHGNAWPIVAFESFGDWKPSGYFYAQIPFIKSFGLNIWAVRLPSMLAGVGLVLIIGKLSEKIYGFSEKKEKQKNLILLIGMFVAAISPWAIQFSRAAWEVNLATFFLTLAVLISFVFLGNLDQQENNHLISDAYQVGYFLLAIVFFILSAYTYHATRVISPILGLGVMYLWLNINRKENKLQSGLGSVLKIFSKKWRVLVPVTAFSLVLFLPILLSLTNTKISQRFDETSVFSDLSIIEESNTQIADSGNTWVSKLIYHRYLFFGKKLVSNFFDHFSLSFLFVSGDTNLRHSTGWTGQLYHIEMLFLLLGLFWLIKHWNKFHAFLVFWLLVGIVPAALTKTTPHALRILPTMPVFLLIITFGIYEFLQGVSQSLENLKILFFKKQKNTFILLLGIIFSLYCFEFINFWRYYSKIYPKAASNEWQYGYSEMIQKVKQLETGNNDIPVYISREMGRPAMYYWFYSQSEPYRVQNENEVARKDQGEYLSYQNIHFIDSISEIDKRPAIVAGTSTFIHQLRNNGDALQDKKDYKIQGLDGTTVWQIVILEP